MSINHFLGPVLKILLIFPCLVASAQVNGNTPEFYVFEENGKQGVKNSSDKIVIAATYDQVGWSDGEFKIHSGVTGFLSEGKWGLVNTSNKVVAEPQYSSVSVRDSGPYIIASVKKSGHIRTLKGLIEPDGDVVIDFNYSDLEVVNQRIIAWYPGDRNIDMVGLLDMESNVLIPFQFRRLYALGSLRIAAESNDGKFYLFTDDGQQVADFALDSIWNFEKEYARIWSKHKMGLINRNGQVIVSPYYKSIDIDNNGLKSTGFDNWIEITKENEILAEFSYDRLDRIEDSILLVTANSRSWLINYNHERLGEAVLDFIEPFDEGLAVARVADRWGVIRSDGQWLLSPQFKSIDRRNGFFNTRDMRNRWRIYDKFGVEKTQGFYDEIGEYHKLHFPVRKGSFWGMINRAGEEVVNCVFDSLGTIQFGRIPVKFKGSYGIIDTRGNWLALPGQYPKDVINEELYLELQGPTSFLRTYKGDIVYFTDNPIELYNDYFLERLSNGKVWLINYSGVIQVNELENIVHSEPVYYSEFEDIFMPSEGLVGIKKDGKYGFVDDQNRLRIANRYDSIQSFSEGYAAIKLLGRWGFIDKNENLVIQPVYDWVGAFENGLCLVLQDGKYFLITPDGNLPFKSGFEDLKPSYEDRYLVRKNGSYGLVSRDGTLLVNYIYDELEDIGNGTVIVRKSGKYGLLDLNGIDLIPRLYDDIIYDPQMDRYFAKLSASEEVINP